MANSTVGVPDLGMLLCAGLIWCAGLLLTAYGCFLLVLGKIGLSVVLAIGPIFVLLLIFEGTKRFFRGLDGASRQFHPDDCSVGSRRLG